MPSPTDRSPTLTRVVYLRGAGNSGQIWDRVRHAMWNRGWATVVHRSNAWHLDRGGVPVVMCDFSCDLDRTPSPWFGYDRYCEIGLVRARYCPDIVYTTLGAELPAAEQARLARDPNIGSTVLNTRVRVRSEAMELVWLNHTAPDRPYRDARPDELSSEANGLNEVFDEEQLADWVTAAFAAGKTLPAPPLHTPETASEGQA
ncbi:hypothetical protein HNR23_002216 [Nocardiopsis mwathae]|uniref:Uncharacterized protein n=1 Tax=Nocardiopsis mwathae TaxID=1472723 RepID=A0A7W9YIJ9_9ACTN|nr:hypothetical protein [Nocardiopsis mwathae]MBB6172156.1 hypothetical protein [Nocardiopsis mwathae]